ncbi:MULTISPECIES: divalent cation tolerance protein CutA [unclassified Streptomyces]|uniref:divalent cation tolerance protein CutA n=1 Tax=unclassified Streptomyces TaxID=2593676 RepID=UPI0006F1EE02|nr:MULTISPECIES: divalent cation tolerance protein CutA [unclassified Streptomyces]KQX53044.1 cation tolerance protein CutA [Streptomyces sp. Root1304]KRA89965.1 cation tolerance protein CutA [Streptomyces sp. Root66D1]
MIVTVRTTTDARAKAEALARGAVEARLVACAQISGPVTSVYHWRGAIETTEEWQVEFKTTEARYPALEAHLLVAHDYETPEILATRTTRVGAEYARWVERETEAAEAVVSPTDDERPFFVYGTLRPGAYNHDRFLAGRIGTEADAVLHGAVLHDGPGYPYVVPADGGTVVGTLLTPSPGDYSDLFGLLDRLELPVGYERVAMDVERVRDGARVSAWVFLAAPDAPLGEVIESGDWFRRP